MVAAGHAGLDGVRSVSAEEPVDAGHAQRIREDPEVLAPRHRLRLCHAVSSQFLSECGENLRRLGVIVVAAREPVHLLDVRFRCTRGLRLTADDPADGCEHAFPHVRLERADVEFEHRLRRDDVLLQPRMERADREHGHVRTGHLSRYYGLQTRHHVGAQHDRVDGVLRL